MTIAANSTATAVIKHRFIIIEHWISFQRVRTQLKRPAETAHATADFPIVAAMFDSMKVCDCWRVGWLVISAVGRNGGPFRQHGWKRRREVRVLLGPVNQLGAHDR